MSQLFKHLIIPVALLALSSITNIAVAAPAPPYFINPSAEYKYNQLPTATTAVKFKVFGQTHSLTQWSLLNRTKNTIVCSGSLPGMLGPNNLTTSCNLPYISGETKLQVKACSGASTTDCAVSSIKSIFQSAPLVPKCPAYVPGATYKNGDVVSNAGGYYACDVDLWCSTAASAYVPGVGWGWTSAWHAVGASTCEL